MYHPIDPIDCPPLEKLSTLARLTIEFGVSNHFTLPEGDIREHFIHHFIENGYPDAGEWLWGKAVVIRSRVLRLVNIPLDQKSSILPAFIKGQNINTCFSQGQFREWEIVSKEAREKDAFKLVNELVFDFYEKILVSSGVPGGKIGEIATLDRQSVLQTYIHCQKKNGLKVCPGCDGPPPSKADGFFHEDFDHFLPKSKYQFLAIHPLNLTPFCKHCNQTYKKDKDAIIDNDPIVQDVHSLNDIYHPYLLTAKENLNLSIKLDSNSTPHFVFSPKINNPNENARLHSLRYLLNLENRWDGDLEEERIQELLENYIMHGSQIDTSNIEQMNLEWLTDKLKCAVDSFRRGIGRIPEYVPALAYAEWVLKTPTQLNQWLIIIKKGLSPRAGL